MKKNKLNKILKYVLTTLIIVAILVSLIIVNKKNIKENHYISESEWIEKLQKYLDKEITSVKATNNNATGEYIAYSSVKILDESIGLDLLNDSAKKKEDYINAAIELNIIPRSKLKTNYTEKAADLVASKIIDIYIGLDDLEEYCDIQYKEEIINANTIKDSGLSNSNDEIILSFDNNVPKEGDIVTFKNEFGFSQIKKVEEVKYNSQNEYKIKCSNIEDITEVIDDITFSGKGTFSYLDSNKNDNDANTVYDKPKIMCAGIFGSTKDEYSDEEIDWASPVDITIKAEIKGDFKNSVNEGYNDETLETIVSSSNDDISVSAEIEVKPKGLTTSIDKISYKKTNEINSISKISSNEEGKKLISESSSSSLSLQLDITDFSIGAKGHVKLSDLNDKNNYVEIYTKQNMKVSVELMSSKSADSFIKEQIASIPIPISGTPLGIYLNLYATFTIDGKVDISWEFSECNFGIKVSNEEKLSFPHSYKEPIINITGSSNIKAGITGEGQLKLFNCWNLANPGIKAVVDIDYEVLNKNEGFENYEPCRQLTISAPIVDVNASIDKDSIVGEILNGLKVKASYSLITKDQIKNGEVKIPSFYQTTHIETDLNGKKTRINGEAFETCTHRRIENYDIKDLSNNPDATNSDINANELHFDGVILEPKDVVLKMFDAMNNGDYETAVECLDPNSEKILDFVGSLAAGLNSYLTGENKTWGQLALENAGAQDVSLIKCETINISLNSNDNVVTDTLSKIPLVNNLYCTDATIRVKYRYLYAGKYHTIEEEYNVHRYTRYGWRIDAYNYKSNIIE